MPAPIELKKRIERQQKAGQANIEQGGCGQTKGEGRRPNQCELLVRLADGVALHFTPDEQAYAVIAEDERSEKWPVRSRGFRDWLSRQFFERHGRPPGSQGISDALSMIEAKARFKGLMTRSFIRVAEHQGRIFIDLANERWESIEIGPDGWRVVQDCPVLFRRTKGMLPLPKPVSKGDLSALKGLLNLVGNDDLWILIAAWLVMAANPRGPYPILNLEGEQGASKTTTARILRAVLDPNVAPVRAVPRNEHDLIIAATNGWIVAFDNLSGVPVWLSDALCRLATGGGFSTRQLYTDGEEKLFDATRPVILTGIDSIAERHDLVDRSIIINLPPINEDRRLTEKELFARVNAAIPTILSAICDAVSHALKSLDATRIPRLPRMADFALWVASAEPTLPWKQGRFFEAYAGNRHGAVEHAVESNPVTLAILTLMDNQLEWRGSMTDLLAVLRDIVPEDTARSRFWPQDAPSLGKRLKRGATFLRQTGISLSTDRDKRSREITIRKCLQNAVTPVTPVTQSTETAPVADSQMTASGDRKCAGDSNGNFPVISNPLESLEVTAGDRGDRKKQTLSRECRNCSKFIPSKLNGMNGTGVCETPFDGRYSREPDTDASQCPNFTAMGAAL